MNSPHTQAYALTQQILGELRKTNADPAVIALLEQMNEAASKNPEVTSDESAEFAALERKFQAWLEG